MTLSAHPRASHDLRLPEPAFEMKLTIPHVSDDAHHAHHALTKLSRSRAPGGKSCVSHGYGTTQTMQAQRFQTTRCRGHNSLWRVLLRPCSRWTTHSMEGEEYGRVGKQRTSPSHPPLVPCRLAHRSPAPRRRMRDSTVIKVRKAVLKDTEWDGGQPSPKPKRKRDDGPLVRSDKVTMSSLVEGDEQNASASAESPPKIRKERLRGKNTGHGKVRLA